MTAETWTLIDPVAPLANAVGSLGGAGDRRIKSLGFLSNRKPTTAELQRGLASRISGAYPWLRIVFFEKQSSAHGAGEDVVTSVEEIRHEVATYETACSRDDNSFSARTHRGPPDVGDFASCRIRLPCLRAIGRAPAVPYQRVSCFRWRYPMARVPHLAFNR